MPNKKLTLFLLSLLLGTFIMLIVRQMLSPRSLHLVRAVHFDDSLLQHLTLPPGFQIQVFATDLDEPRMLAVHPNGSLLVTRPDKNDVLLLEDRNHDGRSDRIVVAASGLDAVHGIAVFQDRIYLASVKEIFVSDIQENGISKPQSIVNDLPDGGNHFRRTIQFGPDGMMYVSIGSTCNACIEENEEHAALLQFTAEGKARKIFARGLRNMIGFDWHPQTGEMWGMDIGSDWLGNDIPPEELNQIRAGGDYGWPFCFGNNDVDSDSPKPPGYTREQYCTKTIASTLNYEAHSTPIGFVFYTGRQFPDEYTNDAFVAMHGSWNRTPPCGYKVVRIHFEEGKPARFSDFISGFLIENGKKYISRPVGLALGNDGSLFVSDDGNGVIYRVSYQGK